MGFSPSYIDLSQLKKHLIEAAGESTAYDAKSYRNSCRTSRLSEHCYVVARFIQKYYGGNLKRAKISGKTHYWNQLPDGKEVDLTSCQFPNGDGFHPLVKGTIAPNPKTENPRVRQFEERVLASIAKSNPAEE